MRHDWFPSSSANPPPPLLSLVPSSPSAVYRPTQGHVAREDGHVRLESHSISLVRDLPGT